MGIASDYLFFPAGHVTAKGVWLLALNQSNAATYPQIVVTGRLLNDPRDTVRQIKPVFTSPAPYALDPFRFIGTRWGDMSGASLDPDLIDSYFSAEAVTKLGDWDTKVLTVKDSDLPPH